MAVTAEICIYADLIAHITTKLSTTPDDPIFNQNLQAVVRALIGILATSSVMGSLG